MHRLIILIGTALFVSMSANAAALVPWPTEEKAAAAESCKQAVRDSVAQDYLTMTSSTELPPDFYQNAAPNLNPILDSCDCAVGKLEKLIGFDYYSAHKAAMPPKIQGLAMGICAPKPPREADADAPDPASPPATPPPSGK